MELTTHFCLSCIPFLHLQCNTSKVQQERQCTYDVTSWRLRETTVTVEKQYALHISACARARVAVLTQHAKRKRRITLSSEVSLDTPRFFDTISSTARFSAKMLLKRPLFLSDFNKIWIFSMYFRNKKFKFHQNPSSGSRIVAFGQPD